MCPACGGRLETSPSGLRCGKSNCLRKYPIIDGVPLLIAEEKSVFSIADILAQHEPFTNRHSGLKDKISRFVPEISKNVKVRENYRKFASLLREGGSPAHVLVLGCGTLGEGMDVLLAEKNIELVETDVAWSDRTALICDAHSIPFQDETFDGVIVQAVLEHVVDPYVCAAEIWRVLKKNALVYAETPFMQQVHGGAYDFTRFTALGHRRLFRHFDEIESGAVGGSGMALAWAYQYFWMSLATTATLRTGLKLFSRFTSFFLKYLDVLLIDHPATLDAAAGVYFLGRKAEQPISDRELIGMYRGMSG
jgi:SAM-dependent methyltransferase